ncbi:VIT1/CCC1 transporter family protein [Halopiger aswanensis]|uniref:Putative membrane protein (TIGR00267 family) n=1 Tax=Halopiger aswanensis TaxID=148449 RepID=A0A419W0J6_9EURY|nr:VIT1/CCC1 transporter family protein [Halopiger aswanensis]RKD88969.1 putative membrane protein (TIGR00267 family) [Halopiger aswanensis]
MPSLRDRLEALRTLLENDEVRSISRRYFISNGFDGTLTSIGVVVGAYLSGITDGLTVITIGLGAAVGLGTSGVWSVWEIERAEKQAELLRIEQAMLTDLEETTVGQRRAGARKINAVASGIGPLIGILLPLVPFLGQSGGVVSMLGATVLAIGVGVAVLFTFGAYLGSISKQNWIVAGIRMGLAGIVVAILNLFLPG